MLSVALFCPQIPPNTGNIIRLCANTGVDLHLIEPLGFALDDKRMRRAGLDYHEFASVQIHPNFADFTRSLALNRRILALTTKASHNFYQAKIQAGDVLLFGSETTGLSQEVHDQLSAKQKFKLPMRAHSRSINLSNAVAVCVFEAWRQLGFVDLQTSI